MGNRPILSLAFLTFVITAAFAALTPAVPGGAAPGTPVAGKPTAAELKARLVALRQVFASGTEQAMKDAVAELKQLKLAPPMQELIADLYPGAEPKERVVLLYILDKIGVEHAVKALPAIATDFAVARPKHPN